MPPSFEHELFVALLRDAEVVRVLLGVAGVDAVGPAGVVDATLTAPEQRADLLVLFGTEAAPSLAVVVEVQRSVDDRKRLSWPHYETSARARHGCDACVLVFATNATVAGWAAEPIRVGPMNTFRALVVDVRNVPAITDPERARAFPALSVLSAVAHGHDAAAVPSAKAAIAAVRTLPAEVGTLYWDAILEGMDEAARRELEASMELIKGYKYQSDFAKKYFHEGEVEHARAAVFTVLAARKLPVSEEVRARIQACTDLATLDAWLDRAAVASTADELV